MENLLLDVSGIRIGRRLSCDALQFFAGQQIHLLGPNGSGKSTLLAALADAVRYEGQIRYRGTDLKSIPKRQQAQFRAYLTQNTDGVPVMTVFQYLQLYMPAVQENTQLIYQLCGDFQLELLLPRMLTQLSGGEWQRVKIAAIFLQLWTTDDLSGKYLLLDEPRNHLDITQQAMLDKWIARFCEQQGTIITSGHDLNHSYLHADAVVLLKAGQLLAAGETQIIMTEDILSELFQSEIKSIRPTQETQWQITDWHQQQR
ncbi:TPA: ATP-binding cassette domain-containing protein [Morganella morganii]|nr:ATP-binding cassette domain-containing protein [Morganella morganii]